MKTFAAFPIFATFRRWCPFAASLPTIVGDRLPIRNALVCAALIAPLTLFVVGCGPSQSDQEAQELRQRQLLREQANALQTKSLEERLKQVHDFMNEDNMVMAEQMLRPLLISDPEHPGVLECSARILQSQGKLFDAVETLEQIETEDPAFEEGLQWMATDWLVEAFVYDVAETKLNQLLELPGDHVRVHRQLAAILNNQGRRVDAADHLRELARMGAIREKELLAMNTLSSVFIDETLPKPTLAGRLHPVLLAKTRLLHSTGDLDGAIELIRQLRKAFPNSTAIAAFEFRLYGDAQQGEWLREWTETAPAGVDREPEYWATLGMWWQRQDRHREAVRCLAEAVRRDPTDRFSYDRMQRSLRLLGEEDSARQAADRVDMLAETASLAEKLGQQRGTPEQLDRMAELLMDLHRPWESIAWREVALRTYGGTDEDRSRLQEQRESIEDADQDAYVLCDLKLADWPLPSELLAVADSVRPGSASPDATPSQSKQYVLDLQNRATATGLVFRYDNGDEDADDRSRLLHQLTGGGIGVIDYDLDGWADVYFAQGGGDAFDANGSLPNRLMRNHSGDRWTDVTLSSNTGDTGYGQGVEVADLNQDGFPDLVVANVGVNVVYINNGDGTFSRQSLPEDVDLGRWTTSIACGDLDRDGLPELVEVNYVDDPRALVQRCTPSSSGNCNPKFFNPAIDRVWKVDSSGTLRLWTEWPNDQVAPAYGFAALIADFDRQGGNELFVANDAGANHLWLGIEDPSTGSVQLSESARTLGCAVGHDGLAKACMGVAWGDFDRNGRLDLHITNFWNEPADVYLQRSTGLFVAAGASMGVFPASRQNVGWGTVAVDLDRDGWLDLAVLNGHVREDPRLGQPFDMKPQVFLGGRSGFILVDGQSLGDSYWSDPKSGRTMAALDWNRDGTIDLLANHLDEPVALLENRTKGGRNLRLRLVGIECERDAVGATLLIESGGEQWVAWQTGGDGFLCSQESVIDFGVGELSTIERLEVSWPSGKKQEFSELNTNAEYLIIEGQASPFLLSPAEAQPR